MRILLINKYLYPRGGDSISILQTGELFRRKGHDVNFWGIAHPENPEYPFAEFFVKKSDYHHSRGGGAGLESGVHSIYSWNARHKLSALLKEWQPEVVHLGNITHQLSPSILDAIKPYRIPVVMTMYDYKQVCPVSSLLCAGKLCEECRGGKFYNCLNKRCSRGTFTPSLLNTIAMYLHHRVWKIYTGIDCYISPSSFLMNKVVSMGFQGDIVQLPHFIELPLKPREVEKEDVVFYAGRLSREKGVDTLLDAAKQITATVKIAGDGPLKSMLLRRLRKEKIRNVIYLGQLSREEVLEEIEKARLVILPSYYYENYPGLVLEAFSRGVPVLGSHLGGIPELIQDDVTGYTFSPGKGEILAEKINYLLLNPRLVHTMGQNALQRVKQQNNPQKYYHRLLELYRKLQKKKMQI